MNDNIELFKINEYIEDLRDKDKYDEIIAYDFSGNSWTIKPKRVIEARFERINVIYMVHVEDDVKVIDFPASEVKTFIRFKHQKKSNNTMKIINREKEYKTVTLHDSLGIAWKFDEILSIVDVHELDEDMIIIEFLEYRFDTDVGIIKQKKVLYLYDNNITGVEFTK